MPTNSHGGARPGAGRPSQFDEPTQRVRVPESLVPVLADELAAYRLRRQEAQLGLTPAASNPRPLLLPAYAVKVAAGFPSPADDYLEDGIDLNKLLVRNAPATFFYTVESEADSMDLVGIFGGDRIMVDRSIEPRSGMIVLALILGEGATVKELDTRGCRARLVPRSSNPKHKPRVIRDGDEVHIIGVVTTAIRQFKTR